jgi:DNA-binding IclR family transcriptional regulator
MSKATDSARPAAPAAIATHVRGVQPVASVLKTLELLDFLGSSPGPLRLTDITRQIGGNRATHYQRLLTLMTAGWVEVDDAGLYRLALHATHVGQAALRHASLGDRAQGVLASLAHETGETASLAMLDGRHIRIAMRAEPEGVLKAKLHVGEPLSFDGSASGRVMAAFLPPARLALLGQQGVKFPDAALLHDARATGYALSSGRDMPEVMAVAVPVFDGSRVCYGALSLVGPVSRFDLDPLLLALQRAAQVLDQLHGA